MDYDGEDRSYHFVMPENLEDEEAPAGLLIVLHGSGGSGAEMLEFGGFTGLAASHKLLAVFPDGLMQYFNYLEEEQLHPDDEYKDDTGFLLALIDSLIDEYSIPEDQVYLAGYSNGGMMTLRMMCSHGDRLAGIGVIAANFSIRLVDNCMDATPCSGILDNWHRRCFFPLAR